MDDSRSFLETVEIAQGRKRLSRRYRKLVDRFGSEFGIRVLNAAFDSFRLEDNSLRLTVWVATDADKAACRDASGNYDEAKQQFAASLVRPTPAFVCFSSYQDQAGIEFVHFSKDRFEEAPSYIGDSRILRIDAVYKSTVIFVRTDEERDALFASPEKLIWEDRLWEWLAAQRPPEIIPREKFSIEIDSQENYDVHFKGNGYWYWR